MKSLCFSGCSYTFGHGLDNLNQRYSRLVSDHYGVIDNNISLCGAGNDDIVRRTVKYLENNEVDIVVIQYSDISRTQWISENGKYQNWTPSTKNRQRYDTEVHRSYYEHVYNRQVGIENAYKNIYLFDRYCRSRGQKYLPVYGELRNSNYDTVFSEWKKLYKSKYITRIYPTGHVPVNETKHPCVKEHKMISDIIIKKIDEITV